MTAPELSGYLDGLKIADVDDAARYKAAVHAGKQMGWGCFFPYLLSRNRPGRAALFFEDEGSMCVFLWRQKADEPRLDLYLAPVPMNVSVLRRCIERANDFNGDRSARVFRIDAKDADAVSEADLLLDPGRSQYLYAPDSYMDLRGKATYTIRRNVSAVERMPDVKVMPYTESHAAGCHALLDRWKAAYPGDVHGTAGGVRTSSRIVELAGTIPSDLLAGEVVYAGERLVAFAFGGEIRPGLAACLERKADPAIRGLSYFQLHRYLLGLRRFDLVNDGSDINFAGLRQFKESFRPAAMHETFQATQR